jgi:hypothetical protein
LYRSNTVYITTLAGSLVKALCSGKAVGGDFVACVVSPAGALGARVRMSTEGTGKEDEKEREWTLWLAGQVRPTRGKRKGKGREGKGFRAREVVEGLETTAMRCGTLTPLSNLS